VLHGRISRRLARITGLATLLAALGCAAGGQAAHAAYPGQEGRIAFFDRNEDLRVVKRDGLIPRTLVNDGSWESSGLSASPDGRRIAFTQWAPCDGGCTYLMTRLSVVSRDGGAPSVLYLDNKGSTVIGVRGASWSPDGKQIVFSAEDTAHDRGLYVIDVAGGAPRRLAITGVEDAADPAWSPDGSRIAFSAVAVNGERRRVFSAPAAGGGASQLTSGGLKQWAPSWSPDGREIAFLNTPIVNDSQAGRDQLAKTASGGGGTDVLYGNPRPGDAAGTPAWSPDGAHIAFGLEAWGSNDWRCDGQLMTIAADGGTATRVMCNPHAAPTFIDWGPRPLRGDTKLVSAAHGKGTDGGNGESGQVGVSRNGRYTVFSSRANDILDEADHKGFNDVFRRDLASGEVERVSVNRDGAVADGDSSLPVTSADGRYVAFRSTAKDLILGHTPAGRSAVYLRDVESDRTIAVSRHEGVSDPLAVSDDGRYVLFGNDATGTRHLFRFDRTTGQTVTIAGGNGEALDARMSADGRYVAFTSRATDLVAGFDDRNGAQPSVFLRDAQTGTTTLVDGHEGSATATTGEVESPVRLDGVSNDGSAVLFTSAATDVIAGFRNNNLAQPDVYRRNVAAPAAELASFYFNDQSGSEGAVGGAALSADGKTVVYASDQLSSTNDPNGAGLDVFLRRYPAAKEDERPELLTIGGDDVEDGGNGTSDVLALSADGRQALIATQATDVGYPVERRNGQPVLLRIDLRTHLVTPITDLDDTGPEAPVLGAGLSGNGTVAVYTTDADNVLAGFSDRNGESADGFAWLDRALAENDEIAPDVEIETPVDGGIYRAGRFYLAEYDCRDFGGSGLRSCVGSVADGTPFDTETVGEKTFTVTAADGAGNTTTRSVDYRVVPVNHQLTLASRAAGTQTNGADGTSVAGPIAGEYALFESAATDLGFPPGVFRRNLATGALVQVAGAELHALGMSGDGRFVLLTSNEHLFLRDVQAGTTKRIAPAAAAFISGDGKLVAFRSEEAADPSLHGTYTYDIATGAITRIGGGEPHAVQNGHVLYTDGGQLRLDDKVVGTGTNAQLSADGTVVAYERDGVVFRNAQSVGEGTGARLSGDGTTVAFQAGGDIRIGAKTIEDAKLHGLSDDGRFVLYATPHGDLFRRDLAKDRTSHVASGATAPFEHVALSPDGRRAVLSTAAEQPIDDFVDGNGPLGADVFTWFDVPPVPEAEAKITGPLTLAFDGSASSDTDGEIVEYRWEWGDGQTTIGGAKLSHTYPDDGTYTVKLTTTDDGSNEVTFAFEVIAIKGVLTANEQPLDFLGVDKTLRCSVVLEVPLYADTGGACGTFVALGGTVYGPADVIAGTTAFTPVSQVATLENGVAELVTTVALGETGVKLRQTDAYQAGRGWYRTDAALVNDNDAARTATIYRAAHCNVGVETERRSVRDEATGMAACEGALTAGRALAALLPLTPGARHEAGTGVLDRVKAGAELANACTCEANVPEHSMGIAWSVTAPAKGEASRASVGAFGPDGVVPLTVALTPVKPQVQPLDENAFALVVRNPNATALPVGSLAVDSDGVWDYTPGTSSGFSTANPAIADGLHTWKGPFTVAGHGFGEQHFAVAHRNGQRTAVTTASAAHDATQFAGLTSAAIADIASSKASVEVRSIEGSIPNTAIFGGPAGLGTDPEPRFELAASKDEGITFECRFAPGEWSACDSDYRPGPLADGAYALEVRAKDVFGTDETPAKRSFAIDTLAPTTVIASGPAKVTTDTRPVFTLRANEPGATFECRFGDAPFAPCDASFRAGDLADGEHRFEARASDQAGNADATPAAWTFRVDTTAPITVISAIDGKGVKAVRPGAPPSTASTGASLALGADGSAGLKVACPADAGSGCDGTVGLAMESAARASRAGASIPSNAVMLTRETFSAAPGETVTVQLELPMSTRNQVDRFGRVAVFATVQLGADEAVRGDDLVLTPDPRTVRLLDAGREVQVKGAKAKLRLLCPKGHAGACRGTVNGKSFAIKAGRTKKVSVKAKHRQQQLSVLMKTRATGGTVAKRLTVTLRAKEARR
jgi:Tol biopolymer transport system component/PKD repeat protein